MFACVRGEDEDSVLGPSNTRLRHEQDADDDIINRVLEEGLRLKKRCKTLSHMLEERDAQLAAERDARENSALTLHDKVKFEVSKVDQFHALELSRLWDSHREECAQLYQQLDLAREEIHNHEEQLDCLEREKASLRDELNHLQSQYEAEKKAALLRREDGLASEQRTTSLRRALLAENEVQRLLTDTAVAERAVQSLKDELARSQAQVQALTQAQTQALAQAQVQAQVQAQAQAQASVKPLSVSVPVGLDREDSGSLAVSPPSPGGSPGGCSFTLSEVPSPIPEYGTSDRPTAAIAAQLTSGVVTGVGAGAGSGASVGAGAGTGTGTSTSPTGSVPLTVQADLARLQSLLETSTAQLAAAEVSRGVLEREIQDLNMAVELEQHHNRQLRAHCEELELALQDTKEEVRVRVRVRILMSRILIKSASFAPHFDCPSSTLPRTPPPITTGHYHHVMQSSPLLLIMYTDRRAGDCRRKAARRTVRGGGCCGGSAAGE